jgi:hypothetical protein
MCIGYHQGLFPGSPEGECDEEYDKAPAEFLRGAEDILEA